ncbi:MAG TPA: CBS domain-containing protein [Gemmataceae bacterium]|jgi:CBS domain-containing protein
MPVQTSEWQKQHPWEPSPLSQLQPVSLVKPSDLFNPMLTIADVMKRQAPTCSPDASLAEAARILRDAASEAVFVVSDGRPLGLLTDRRIALAVAEHGENLGRLRVQDVMKHRPPTVRADARLGDLLETFADEGVAVVDDDGRIQGVVRWLELIGHLSERALGKLIVNLFSPRKER